MHAVHDDDFEALVRRAGLSLSPEQAAHIRQGWALLQPMLERLRDEVRERSAEPALVFRAQPAPQA